MAKNSSSDIQYMQLKGGGELYVLSPGVSDSRRQEVANKVTPLNHSFFDFGDAGSVYVVDDDSRRLALLDHTHVELEGGGHIYVIDDGAVINAEAKAMLQALHSRSAAGIKGHLEVLAKKGPDDFMKNFYVGYGHKSIGDCGDTTIFVEGVSMLAAKAIQDNPLYSGQEASTRYIDFSEQPFVNPLYIDGSSKAVLNPAASPISPIAGALPKDLLEGQRAFYMAVMDPVRELLRAKHPKQEGEKKRVYRKAIDARAFDITRSLLPAGASTNLAWHTNLRQAADRILFLRHHPLAEVRQIANGLEQALQTHHPNSFGHKRYAATEAYQDIIASEYYFFDPSSPSTPVLDSSFVRRGRLDKSRHLFDARPEKTELPKYLAQLGTVEARFQLDFGSFRDIQRHRAINQRMPLLTAELGFNDWYRENLPEEFHSRLDDHLGELLDEIDRLDVSPEEAQYFLPMGYNTSNQFTGDLPATVYMIELRDSRFVHPTLQRVARSLGDQISEQLDIKLHIDSEANRFDVKRGEHDITLKEDEQ